MTCIQHKHRAPTHFGILVSLGPVHSGNRSLPPILSIKKAAIYKPFTVWQSAGDVNVMSTPKSVKGHFYRRRFAPLRVYSHFTHPQSLKGRTVQFAFKDLLQCCLRPLGKTVVSWRCSECTLLGRHAAAHACAASLGAAGAAAAQFTS